MNSKRNAAVIVAAVLLISYICAFIPLKVTGAVQSLGSITECDVDIKNETVKVAGSIKHSVLVENRSGKIALYRFAPWDDVESLIKNSVPLATVPMSIRFEFKVQCKSVLDRLSLYAVAVIDGNGAVNLICDPEYSDMRTADTSNTGFKGIATSNISPAIAAHPGSTVIDVYLDKLDNGKKSGFIFKADGDLFYFDRNTIEELDKKVLSYTSSGCDIFFRFLISPTANGLPFCNNGDTWATNKCITVDNSHALNAVYSITYFLISRYDGGNYGKVDGIILGRGADLPVKYNYAVVISEKYSDVYARSLSVIGLAAAEAAGENNISLVVPVGDSLTADGNVYAGDFLRSVSEYMTTRTNLTFTVMCESTHNPYKLTDKTAAPEIDETASDEVTDIPFDETTACSEVAVETTSLANETVLEETTSAPENVPEPETSQVITDYVFEETSEYTDDAGEYTQGDDETDTVDTPIIPERPMPTVTQNSDGYFCTDNIDIFTRMFNKLKKDYSAVNDGFAWCWYPDDETVSGALCASYAYNYMKLVTLDADFYVVAFETDNEEKAETENETDNEKDIESKDKFSSLSYMFKYIDTVDGIAKTEYVYPTFGISDWGEIIHGFKPEKCVDNLLYEGTLEKNVIGYTGNYVYVDFDSKKVIDGWHGGVYCDPLAVKTENGISYLQTTVDFTKTVINQAEIGYILSEAEPMFIGDSVTFDVLCGNPDGSIYEITICFYSDNSTFVSKCEVNGGEECKLSFDVTEYDKSTPINSIKILIKQVLLKENCTFGISRVTLNSRSASDSAMAKEFNAIKESMNSNVTADKREVIEKIVVCVLALSTIGVVSMLIAYGNDRRNRSSAVATLNDSEGNENDRN